MNKIKLVLILSIVAILIGRSISIGNVPEEERNKHTPSKCIRNLSKDTFSDENLPELIKKFNEFYHRINPSASHLELRLDLVDESKPDGLKEINLHTTKNINLNEEYATITNEHMITPSDIYNTKYSDTMGEIEELYGYDDMTNMTLMLILEKFNPDSKWKPYLDLLPKRPSNLISDFWNDKDWIEPILKGTYVSKKAIEYKLSIDNRVGAIYNTFVKEYPDVFDEGIFCKENLEWALYTVDSKMVFVGYEAFIIPMLEYFKMGISKVNGQEKRTSTNELKRRHYDHDTGYSDESQPLIQVKFYAQDNFTANSVITENPKFANDRLLISYGRFVLDKPDDCFNISLSFSAKKEDSLAKERERFFQKYFLFDMNNHDIV